MRHKSAERIILQKIKEKSFCEKNMERRKRGNYGYQRYERADSGSIRV